MSFKMTLFICAPKDRYYFYKYVQENVEFRDWKEARAPVSENSKFVPKLKVDGQNKAEASQLILFASVDKQLIGGAGAELGVGMTSVDLTVMTHSRHQSCADSDIVSPLRHLPHQTVVCYTRAGYCCLDLADFRILPSFIFRCDVDKCALSLIFCHPHAAPHPRTTPSRSPTDVNMDLYCRCGAIVMKIFIFSHIYCCNLLFL